MSLAGIIWHSGGCFFFFRFQMFFYFSNSLPLAGCQSFFTKKKVLGVAWDVRVIYYAEPSLQKDQVALAFLDIRPIGCICASWGKSFRVPASFWCKNNWKQYSLITSLNFLFIQCTHESLFAEKPGGPAWSPRLGDILPYLQPLLLFPPWPRPSTGTTWPTGINNCMCWFSRCCSH